MSEINRVYYNKLVRDNIPNKIAAKHQEYDVRKITDVQELQQELFKKVQEEAASVSMCRTKEDFLEEYCDLMVVLETLVKQLEIPREEVIAARKQNLITKGGYKHIYNEAATIGLARDYYARFGYVLYDTDLCNTTDDEVTIAHKKSLQAPPKNIDKEKLALFRACLKEDPATRNDPSSSNSKFYEKYKIYYFECDLCNEIDFKLKSFVVGSRLLFTLVKV